MKRSQVRLFIRLAWRNVWRQRRRSLIVFLAIGLTLALMMFYDGLVAGFEEAIYGNAIRVLGGHIQIHAAGYSAEPDETPLLPVAHDGQIVELAQALPQVAAATRRINTGGLVSSREGAYAVTIVGIEPERELPLSLVAQHVVAGRFLAGDDRDVVFIGQALAKALGVTAGERVTLVGRAALGQMRRRTMTVAGVYDIGLADIEKRTVYISLAEAQDLVGLHGQVTEIVLTLERVGQEREVLVALRPRLPDCEIASWQTSFPELEAAMGTKGGVMNVFSVILLLIAGIGILNLLMMAVYERTREIGILGALGLKPRQVALLFVLEGATMALAGVACGVALGLLINLVLGRVGLDYSQFSSMTEYMALISGRVYPTLGLERLFQRAPTALVVAVLASLYPARQAARQDPARALHHV